MGTNGHTLSNGYTRTGSITIAGQAKRAAERVYMSAEPTEAPKAPLVQAAPPLARRAKVLSPCYCDSAYHAKGC